MSSRIQSRLNQVIESTKKREQTIQIKKDRLQRIQSAVSPINSSSEKAMITNLERQIRKDDTIRGSFQQVSHEIIQRGKLVGGLIQEIKHLNVKS